MARSTNAQIAVNLYHDLRTRYEWTADTAWHGIARLLFSCEVFQDGWQKFHNVVVYRERNDLKIGPQGPSAALRRAEALTTYLAEQLGVERKALCREVGLYW